MSNKLTRTEAVIPEDLLAAMLMALPATAPSSRRQAGMKKSLLSRVEKLASEKAVTAATTEMLVVRANEGHWSNFAPSVDMKVLYDDGDTRTWLARFEPGGHVAAHLQTGDEEAIIMEGWCYLDGAKMNCGDYHMIRKGARHGSMRSPEGCLIFVRSHSLMRHASELTAAR